MKRLPDWRSRLQSFVESSSRRRFRPGSHDCALFAAGAIEAMTGTDLATEWRGTYRNLAAGREALADMGHATLSDIAASHLAEIPAIMGREGDLVVLEDADGLEAFGIVQGALIYVLRLDGLGLEPLTSAKRAFRV